MVQINPQALREAAEQAMHDNWGFDADLFHELVTPSIVLALLDERERNQQYVKRRDKENEDIALTVGRLRVELEAAEKRNAKLQSENAYIRNRFKELDLLIGKNILVMQAAIMELHKWFWEQSEAERAAGIRIKGA